MGDWEMSQEEYTEEQKAYVADICRRRDEEKAEQKKRFEEVAEREKLRKSKALHAIAFTFAEGQEWQLLTKPLECVIAQNADTHLLVMILDTKRAQLFNPAAIILSDGRLWDNILGDFDFTFVEFSNKQYLLESVAAIKERIENEYPGSRRGPEAV